MVSGMKWMVVDINRKIGYKGPGVYKIQLVNKNGKPVEIRRFGGTDKEGPGRRFTGRGRASSPLCGPAD